MPMLNLNTKTALKSQLAKNIEEAHKYNKQHTLDLLAQKSVFLLSYFLCNTAIKLMNVKYKNQLGKKNKTVDNKSQLTANFLYEVHNT